MRGQGATQQHAFEATAYMYHRVFAVFFKESATKPLFWGLLEDGECQTRVHTTSYFACYVCIVFVQRQLYEANDKGTSLWLVVQNVTVNEQV